MGFKSGPPNEASKPLAIACQCPNCGHGVFIMFRADKGKLEAIGQGQLAQEVPSVQQNGTSDLHRLAAEADERRAKLAERPRATRIFDPDQKQPPRA